MLGAKSISLLVRQVSLDDAELVLLKRAQGLRESGLQGALS